MTTWRELSLDFAYQALPFLGVQRIEKLGWAWGQGYSDCRLYYSNVIWGHGLKVLMHALSPPPPNIIINHPTGLIQVLLSRFSETQLELSDAAINHKCKCVLESVLDIFKTPQNEVLPKDSFDHVFKELAILLLNVLCCHYVLCYSMC